MRDRRCRRGPGAAVHRYLARRSDDLVSETFLIAFRHRAAYRAVHAEVRPWVLGIATNLLHAHSRAQRPGTRRWPGPAATRDEQPADPGSSPTGCPAGWRIWGNGP